MCRVVAFSNFLEVMHVREIGVCAMCMCVHACVRACVRALFLKRLFRPASYLPEYLRTRWPAKALCQSVCKPYCCEHLHRGRPREQDVHKAHQGKTQREEQACAQLVRQEAAHKLTDGVGQGQAAYNEAYTQGKLDGPLACKITGIH